MYLCISLSAYLPYDIYLSAEETTIENNTIKCVSDLANLLPSTIPGHFGCPVCAINYLWLCDHVSSCPPLAIPPGPGRIVQCISAKPPSDWLSEWVSKAPFIRGSFHKCLVSQPARVQTDQCACVRNDMWLLFITTISGWKESCIKSQGPYRFIINGVAAQQQQRLAWMDWTRQGQLNDPKLKGLINIHCNA